MGTINVVVRVDHPPEASVIPDPLEPMVELHYVLEDGGTLDILMTRATLTATLAAGAVLRATMEQAYDAAR